LTGRPLRDSLNSFYRAADALFRRKDALEPHLARRERSLFDLSETLCLFDLTNTFLEGRAARNPKARFGRSKEKRSDCRLLTLGLSVDEDGFPKYSRLFSGNQSEPETLAGMVEHMAENGGRGLDRPTVVVDAGIATKANLAALREAGFHYMAVERSRSGFSPADLERMRVVVRDDAADFTLEAVRVEADGEVRLLCRSSRRMKKENGVRRNHETRFLEALTALRDGLSRKGTTKKYAKVAERVGRIRQKHPRASKWYEVTVVPKDASRPETTLAVDVRWEKNARAKDDAALEGCYVVRSDRADLGDGELWKTWTMLSRVERAFRTLKSDLGLRPNFHQLEGRADAHMFISVLADHILNAVEHRLRERGDNRSWATIRDVLSTHRRMTVEFDGTSEEEQIQRRHLRLCSRPEPEHREICDRLGLSHEPLPKKHFVAK
jgi:transposase